MLLARGQVPQVESTGFIMGDAGDAGEESLAAKLYKATDHHFLFCCWAQVAKPRPGLTETKGQTSALWLKLIVLVSARKCVCDTYIYVYPCVYDIGLQARWTAGAGGMGG